MTSKTSDVLMFSERLQNVGITDFGISVEAIMTGQAQIPPLGLRADGQVQGEVSGPGLEGTVEGTDYVLIQGDGTIKVHAHCVITTHDGARISVLAEGIGRPQVGSVRYQLREMLALQTEAPAYRWVNDKRSWAVGEFDAQTGEITLEVYAMAEELETN